MNCYLAPSFWDSNPSLHPHPPRPFVCVRPEQRLHRLPFRLQTPDFRPQTSNLRPQRTTRSNTRPTPAQALSGITTCSSHAGDVATLKFMVIASSVFHHARTILGRVSPASAPVTAMRQTSDSAPSRGLDGVCLSLSPPTHPHTHVPQPCRRPCSDFDSSPGHLRTRSATRKRRPMTDPSPATVRSWARKTGAQPTTAMGPEARPVRLTPLREQAG